MTAPHRVWLVRHGETTGQSSVRFFGATDVPLSDVGRGQIRALVPLLAGLQPRAVVHSPLVRAAESASILAGAHAWTPASLTAEERLREISFGACEGLTAEEIAAAHPAFWQRHQRGEADAFPDGESRAAFAVRVAAAVADAVGEAGDVVVVAHRGTVRQALRHLLGIPAGMRDPFAVQLGSLSVLRREGRRWDVELLDFVPKPAAG